MALATRFYCVFSKRMCSNKLFKKQNYKKASLVNINSSVLVSIKSQKWSPWALEMALGPGNSLPVLQLLGKYSLSVTTTTCHYYQLADSSDDHQRGQDTAGDRQELQALRWWTLPRRPTSLGLPCTASVLLMMECRASSFLSSAA